MSEGDAQEMTRACPDCGHGNPYSHRYCEECGGALRSADRVAQTAAPSEEPVEPPPIPPPSRRRGVARAAALDKHAARREFAKVKTIVTRLRAIFVAGVLVAVVQLLLVAAVSAHTKDADPDVINLLYLLFGVSLMVKIGGAVLVARQPMIWAVVIAAEHTLTSLIDVAVSGITIGGGINLFFIVPFWAGVAQAARLQRVMAENPELKLKRDKLGDDRRVLGGLADDMRQRRRADQSRGATTWLRVLAVVVPVVALGILGIWLMLRPEPVGSRIENFTASWRGGELDALDGMFEEGASSRGALALRESIVRRGWDRRPPKLAEPDLREPGKDYVLTSFSLGTNQIVAHWRFHRKDNVWYLQRVELPDLDAPAIEPFLKRFETAWATSGTDAVLAHLKDSFRARRGTRIASMFESRDWADDRPALGRYTVKPRSNGRAIVDFETEVGDVNLSCEYWYPRWAITGIRLPRN